MKRLLTLLAVLLFLSSAQSQVTYTWRYYSKSLSTGQTAWYLVGMPSDSATNTNKRPVLCFEPGAGETGDGNLTQAKAALYGYARDLKAGRWDGGITQTNGYADSVVYPIIMVRQVSGSLTSTVATTRTGWREVWSDYEWILDYDQIHFGGLSFGGRNELYMIANYGNSTTDPYVFSRTPASYFIASPGGKTTNITNQHYYLAEYVRLGGRIAIATGNSDDAGAYKPDELLPYFNDSVPNSAVGYLWHTGVDGFTREDHGGWDTLWNYYRSYAFLGGKTIYEWHLSHTKKPQAIAQSVINTISSTVTLNGVTNGWYKTVAWTKVSGTGTISSSGSDTTSVTGIGLGTSVYRLTVTNTNDSRTVTHDVTVNRTTTAPVANAGSDQTTTATGVTLSGSATAGTDATITGYAWAKISGSGGTITSASSASTTVTGLSVGTYVYRLTVTQSDGQTDTDDVTITIEEEEAPPANYLKSVPRLAKPRMQ